VPIRLTGAIITLLLALLWCNLASLGCDPTVPYPPLRRRLLIGGVGVFSRILLFFYGYVWIRETNEVTDPEERGRQPVPSLVVCNHVGFAELLFLIYRYGCCFVSKDSNRALPFIGKVAEAMQSIFVQRGGRHNGNEAAPASTSERIMDRLKASAGKWPPLALCPEGTTTTGHCMIHMHTGAFRAGSLVQPVAFRTPFSPSHGYDPSFCCANIVFHVLGLMTQPMNHLHVTNLAVYSPTDADKANAKLFANNVRHRLAEAMGAKTYELEWMHKLEFEINEKSKELGKKLLADRHGGSVPPPPVFTQDAFGNPLESSKNE